MRLVPEIQLQRPLLGAPIFFWDHTRFRHKRVLYISDFSLSLNLVLFNPRPVHKRRDVLLPLLCSLTFRGQNLPTLYIFQTPNTARGYSSFQHPTHAIHVAFPLPFVYTGASCFEIHVT